jgi:hypothetical protein
MPKSLLSEPGLAGCNSVSRKSWSCAFPAAVSRAGWPISFGPEGSTPISLPSVQPLAPRPIPGIYNTNDEAATGNTTLSKIASKILGGIFFVIFLGNQGISKFLKVFGVAMEIFVSPQNRGVKTRLNTAFTPAFWTAAGAESTSDASVCTWALINVRSAG